MNARTVQTLSANGLGQYFWHIAFGLHEGHCPQQIGLVQSGHSHTGRQPSHSGQTVPSMQTLIGCMGMIGFNGLIEADAEH